MGFLSIIEKLFKKEKPKTKRSSEIRHIPEIDPILIIENNFDLTPEEVEKSRRRIIEKYDSIISNNIPLLKLETTEIRSKKFNDILSDLKLAPNYNEKEDATGNIIYSFAIFSIEEYIKYSGKLLMIVDYFKGRKNSSIFINGKLMGKYLIEYRELESELDIYIENYTGYISDFKAYSGIGVDVFSLEEYEESRVVFYPSVWGTFFAFSDGYKEKPHFCICQKKPIENFVKLYSNSWKTSIKKEFPSEVAKNINHISELLTDFEFKEMSCHKCNKIMPKYLTINPMYSGNTFLQRCNPYVNQKFLEYGYYIPMHQSSIMPILPQQFNLKELEFIDTIDELQVMIENLVREEFGINRKGEHWLNETYMANLIRKMFPNKKIIRHYRPKWLSGLELDVYIPDIKLAFEYNGIQHYEPVDYFGGINSFKKQVKRDQLKKELCASRNVDLIIVKYDENLSIELLNQKIKNNTGNSIRIDKNID